MLSFFTHKNILFSRREYWFYPHEPAVDASYNVVYFSKQKPSSGAFYINLTKSVLNDLSKSSDDIYNAIHPNFKYEIRKAEKEAIETRFDLIPTMADCILLIKKYNIFAKSKGLQSINRKRIFALQKSGHIFITHALRDKNNSLTHVYLQDNSIVFLLHSFHEGDSFPSQARSNANKLLHWKDLLLFKEKGFKVYDFGGIDDKLPGISEFKKGFGGRVEEYYSYIKATALLGVVVKIYHRLRNKN